MKFRNECKHYVTELDLAGLRNRMEIIAHKDKHCGENGKYTIKSLYFDNCYDKALIEKQDGIASREKFRIRYYNDDTTFIRLEKKSKISGLCLKQSAPITKKETEYILNGDFQWMAASRYELINELWAKMQYQLLRPKIIVVYEREAFVYAPGNVRVTIDSKIRGSTNIKDFFNSEAVMTGLLNESILEVKWNEYLPQIIRDAVQLENVKTSSFSKYAAVRFSAF